MVNVDPLHGRTLEFIMNYLVDRYGWDKLADKVPVKCFYNNPSIKSSLIFLRKTGWARKRVENIYVESIKN